MLVATSATTHQAARAAWGRRLVLASASPRRYELLTALGATFTVIATDVEDELCAAPPALMAQLPPVALPTLQHPTLLAWRKAQAAALLAPGAIMLGADTVVVLDGMLLNKPGDAATAHAMLSQLSGRCHTVYTGVCVLEPDDPQQPATRQHLALVASEVEFAPISAQTIAAYVASGEPLDKAGAYGLQGMGGQFVRTVRGSYTAVVGLPLVTTYELLHQAGVQGLTDPSVTYQRWLQSQGKDPLPCPPTLP